MAEKRGLSAPKATSSSFHPRGLDAHLQAWRCRLSARGVVRGERNMILRVFTTPPALARTHTHVNTHTHTRAHCRYPHPHPAPLHTIVTLWMSAIRDLLSALHITHTLTNTCTQYKHFISAWKVMIIRFSHLHPHFFKKKTEQKLGLLSACLVWLPEEASWCISLLLPS